ncbi:MAG: ribosomal-processing cysteine protease Prp [Clostridia bacterium]|nr:ribosomal-processing cysteine protease Prp [Clostridia bacterium]
MIRAVFFKSGSSKGFEISGHASSRAYGSDTVCAAVSSAAYMAANTVTEVLKVKADADVSNGYLKFTFDSEDKAAEAVLDGLELHIRELEKEYPKKIKVITEV